jgi:ABC-type sugar transport system permease subunit
MESPSHPVVFLPVCFIGVVSGIFTAWITRREYEALNHLWSRPGLEDDGLEYIIFFVLGLLAAVFFYVWRVWDLPSAKALVAICIIFAGGCLGAILALPIPYYGSIGYFVGLGLGNYISRRLGM